MQNNKGFTLVELMITLVISGILVAAIYSVYTLQQKTYTAQDQVVEMQQNIRAATITMVQELRMAGYDPTDSGIPTIKRDEIDLVYFTADLNEDGDINDTGEHIAFDLYTEGGISKLGITRDNSTITINASGVHFEASGHQAIAENIEEVEFLYDNDENSITISILARSARRDAKFVNNTIYKSASGAQWNITAPNTATNDNFRRRLLITTVQCRNMGL